MPTPARRNPSATAATATGSAPGAQPSLWQLGDAWLRRAAQVIADSADALNAMNVFPISDADTGSNLKLTIGGIASSVTRFQRASLDDVVQAAILVRPRQLRGDRRRDVHQRLPCAGRTRTAGDTAAGRGRGRAAPDVSDAANQAVAEPVLGTILTVADEAAGAAAARPTRRSSQEPLAVAIAAQRGAHEALARTPEQLDVLGRAGVVDAGGQAFVLLIDVLVEVLGGPAAVALAQPASRTGRHAGCGAGPHGVRGDVRPTRRGRRRLGLLRQKLSVLGRSVVVVGDEAVAQVHVHLIDAGAAIEAALASGRHCSPDPGHGARTLLPDEPAGLDRTSSPWSRVPGWPFPPRRWGGRGGAPRHPTECPRTH